MNFLIYLIIGVFLALLFLNLYFRIKVFKVYKVLIDNKVEFNSSHIFNKEKMNSEVLSKYPNQKSDILTFVSHIRFSLSIAAILVLLISLMGYILHQIK